MGLGVFNCETKHVPTQGGRREQRASAWVFKGPGTAKGAINPFLRMIPGQGNGPQHDTNMHGETERSPRQHSLKSPFSMTRVRVGHDSPASDDVDPGQQVITILEQQQQQDGLLGRSRLSYKDEGPVISREGPGVARQGSIDNNKDHAPSVHLSASRVRLHGQGRDCGIPDILDDLSLRERGSELDDVDGTGDAVGHTHISVMEALTEEQGTEVGPRMALRRPVSVMDALLDDKFSGPSQVGKFKQELRAGFQ